MVCHHFRPYISPVSTSPKGFKYPPQKFLYGKKYMHAVQDLQKVSSVYLAKNFLRYLLAQYPNNLVAIVSYIFYSLYFVVE